MSSPPTSPAERAAAIAGGDRRALARAITLVESTRGDHRAQAAKLLDALPSRSRPTFRIGITGTPGVGKSTFIEAFGLHLTRTLGLKVAVLAVDPSSARTGGSILGDKTRMEDLSREPNVYIRPSPSGGTLGGVGRRTREAIRLVEAAGFDVVLVETVGVGQSEIAVSKLTDAFVLLVAPGGGDDLQGVKRGIMELADLVVVNKSDSAFEERARQTLSDYTMALRLMRPSSPEWTPVAMPASALTGLGVRELWDRLVKLRAARESTGEFDARRRRQERDWLWTEITERVVDDLRADHQVRGIEADVEAGRRSLTSAVEAVASRLRTTVTDKGL